MDRPWHLPTRPVIQSVKPHQPKKKYWNIAGVFFVRRVYGPLDKAALVALSHGTFAWQGVVFDQSLEPQGTWT